MGVPLVGPVFMLELGRRRRVPLRLPRVAAAVVGGLIGWSFNAVLDLDLIRLIVPSEAPPDVWRALQACLYVGTSAGLVTGVAGGAIYRARSWRATAVRRLLIGAAAMLMISVVLAMIGGVQAAYGPGGGAIVWAESEAGREAPSTILIVAVLRAAATTAAVAAGGCGGVFVPFLAIGDLAARAFAPGLGVSADLAGAAGAASGIAGG
jgi:H+/Cl- antiporter ClcA